MIAHSNERNFAVVQDHRQNRWLYFHSPVEVIQTEDIEQVKTLLGRIEYETTNNGLYAVGAVSYESAPAFDAILPANNNSKVPLIWFGLYRNFETIEIPGEGGLIADDTRMELDWMLLQDESEYRQALEKIRNYIKEGDTYQVNYSFRLRADSSQDHWPLFVQMVHAQNLARQPGYCVYLETDDWTLCSASPELFFEYHARTLTSRPMKGTAPRGLGFEDDHHAGISLRNSPKNRAENIMIADMVRNDMGKIADTGTVHTRDVLSLEKYPTFWTMTTTVECRTDPRPLKVFEALFPAASITGAPKLRAMQIIDELESLPRNFYTGAAGFISPHNTAQFNVLIRSVLIHRKSRIAEFGVGGGIVWDSRTGDEFEECHTKARVLTYAQPPFELLETFKWSPDNGYRYLDQHLQRLFNSASYFSWLIDHAKIESALVQAENSFAASDQRVRLLVSKSGSVSVTNTELDSLPQPYIVMLASKPVSSKNYFLYHKTTHRSVYENARSGTKDCDDVLLWNESGEITESCRANILVLIDGEWLTPLVSSGLLNGVEREALIASGEVTEKVISVDQLKKAESIRLANSVRGVWTVVLNKYLF
jgi:para-aminobenzoate synthetase/4-amino-4-deoxychorismate lyase